MKCKYKDCNYQHGWDYSMNKHEPEWVEGEEGHFYQLRSGMFDKVIANRFHGDKNDRELHICPKCGRMFMGDVIND